jgi:hypothetical protein
MNRMMIFVLVTSMMIFVGCDARPPTPQSGWADPKAKILDVSPEATDETKLVRDVISKRTRYQTALETLVTFYETEGNLTRQGWAEKEMNNLAVCQQFAFGDVGDVTVEPFVVGPEPTEADLLENVVASRKKYRHSVSDLAEYYESHEEPFKAEVIHAMQARFWRDETFRYLLAVELPPATLRPTQIIPEADTIYDNAVMLHQAGAKKLDTGRYDDQREALKLFREILDDYPTSTKIPMAAYYMGRIYVDYLDDPYLGIQFYKLSLEYNPMIAKCVHFDVAEAWDFGLRNRPRAIKWYRESLKDERYWRDNGDKAKRRIGDLIEKSQYKYLAHGDVSEERLDVLYREEPADEQGDEPEGEQVEVFVDEG